MKKMYDGDIPFHPNPNKKLQLDWASKGRNAYWWYTDENSEDIQYADHPLWWKNKKFLASLEITSFSRGRSAASFVGILHDVDGIADDWEFSSILEGCEVNIFMTDMLHILKHVNFFAGRTPANTWFTFCKRGSNYGLTMLEE
jgi:hypothetical protein